MASGSNDSPAVIGYSSNGSPLYGSPQEHFDAIRDKLATTFEVCEQQSAGSLDDNDDGSGTNNFNDAYQIKVVELVYPGAVNDEGVGDVEPIEEKWLYILENDTLVIEAYADGYHNWAPNNETELGDGADSMLEVEPDKTYSLFLSPVQLSYEERITISDSEVLKLDTVEITTDCDGIVVAIRDPLRWAADAHADHYSPALQTWKEWELDEKLQSQLFVASVLKQWLEAGDPYGIDGHLAAGQPDSWLEEYKELELEKRTAAERAYAYVASIVESSGYSAIIASCIHHGGDDLHHAIFAFSCILQQVNQTLPGRQLADRIANDPDSIPSRYLFVDESPPDAPDIFGAARFTWLAMLSIFSDLAPTYAPILKVRGLPVLESMKLYLEGVGVETLKGDWRRAYRNISAGKDLASGLKKSQRPRFRRSTHKLTKKAEKWAYENVPTRWQKVGTAADKVHGDFEKYVSKFVVPIAVVVETANLVIAITDHWGEDGGDTSSFISALGAGADMTVLVLEVVEELVKKGKFKTALKGAGGAVTFVSGACDAIGFSNDAVEAWGKHDYNASVGSGIAAVGASAGAVSGGMMLASALGYSALGGPACVAVAAIGAVLVMGGVLMVLALTNTPHEHFAEHCFLGRNPNGTLFMADGMPHALPTGAGLLEAENLTALLGNFQLSVNNAGQGDWLTIRPGLVGPRAFLEVVVRREYGNAKYDPDLYAKLKVHLDTDDFEHVDGELLAQESYVKRNDSGAIEKIMVNITPGNRSRKGVHDMLRCWVRLTLSETGATVPLNGKWLRYDGWRQGSIHTAEDSIHSLDSDHYSD